MKRFIIKSIIFSIPLLIVFGFPYYVLHRSGELAAVDRVVELQKSPQGAFWGAAYTSPLKYYKLRSVLARGPKVIALGSSRILEIRSEFFDREVGFFNAGSGVERISHFRQFLDKIPMDKSPDVLIISVDQNFLNPNWDKLTDDNYEKELARGSGSISILARTWDKVIIDYFKNKYSLRQLEGANSGAKNAKIGLNAIVNDDFFRNDGSYHYGRYISAALKKAPVEAEQFRDVFEFMDNDTIYFKHSKVVSQKALESLGSFLKECRRRRIHVIGFLPPYAQAVYEKVVKMREEYAYIFRLEAALRPVFEENGYSFFDFTDMSSFGADRNEVIDGFHASEKAYLRMFIKMAENDKKLAGLSIDLDHLKAKVRSAADCYRVFE